MRKPAEVYPLASFLAEEMDARGWTAIDVASRMTGDYANNICVVNLVLCVHKDNLRLDDCLDAIAQAFDVSAELFRNLHQAWLDNPEARQPFECPEHLLNGLMFHGNDNASER